MKLHCQAMPLSFSEKLLYRANSITLLRYAADPFSIASRREEARIVAQLASKYNSSGYPVIVMGDFNNPSPQVPLIAVPTPFAANPI